MLIVGVGSSFRGDAAAGLLAARRLMTRVPPGVRVLERPGDLVGLLDEWLGHDSVVLLDALQSGAPVGTIVRVDARAHPLPAGLRSSARAFGIAEALAVGRLLRALPARLIVYGVEGDDFTAGAPVAPAVEAAVGQLVERVLLAEVPAPLSATVGAARLGRLFGRFGVD